MKNIKSISFCTVLLAMLCVVTFTSCKKSYLEVNDNPNNLTENNITPELIFPAALVSSAQRSVAPGYLHKWMGYYSSVGDFSIDQQETTYSIDFGYGQGYWNAHYGVLYDLRQTETKALAKNDSVLAGASIILSVKLWQDLVDLFGNIPYTDAFKPVESPQPKYDADTTVYRLLHANLDRAISYMKGTAALTFPSLVATNIKFGAAAGTSQASWIKLANTLKLRLLIRCSEAESKIPGVNRTAEVAKIVANGGVLLAGQSAMVNPGYIDEVNKQSPFYATYGFLPPPNQTPANTSTCANKYFVDSAQARNDLRLQRWYRIVGATVNTAPAQAPIVGTRYGAVGQLFGSSTSRIGVGVAGTATQSQWFISSVESMFLLAEATQRGWFSGSASAAYQAAVNESFSFLGVPSASAAATTYLSNTLADYSNANATLPNGFVFTPNKFIAYQKYIALNGINPLESFCDLRRLNMIPDFGYLSANVAPSTRLPNRLLYPQDEFTLNSSNVLAQGDVTNRNKKIFWQP